MGNPFAATLRAMGVPMLGDDLRAGAGAGNGFGPPPPLSNAPGILPPPDWSAYGRPPQPGPATAPPRPSAAPPPRDQDWGSYVPPAPKVLPEPLDPYPKEKQGGGDIFVGGFWDDQEHAIPRVDLPLGVMKQYADGYAQQTGRPTAYLPNGDVDRIVDAIAAANRTDGPVNLVGHSFGGPDAYNAAVRARQQGLRVDNVITLDPVSGPSGTVSPGTPAGRWTNIAATAPTPNGSDAITHFPGLGHKPSSLPVTKADAVKTVEAHHDDVDAMMGTGPRQILDRSREADPSSAWSDELPTWEWMQRRNAAKTQRR